MADYNITKVMDGLFVSDSAVAFVLDYLLRIVPSWLATRSSEFWVGLLIPIITTSRIKE